MVDGKQLARRIFLRTVDALDVASSISRCVRVAHGELCCGGMVYGLQPGADLRLIAVGKAAHGMLDGFVTVLPPDFALNGIVSAPTSPANPHPGFHYFVGGHPTPNQQSFLAGEAALALLRGCDRHTVVVVLLSGGGSALMEHPLLATLSMAQVQEMHRALVSCGASIAEINTVRKHLSAVKGGRLAQAAVPARVLTLAISDVPAGQESALGSGPTLPDPTTINDVQTVVAKYGLRNRLPTRLMEWVERGEIEETPKAGDPAFARNNFQLVLGMHELFHAAHRFAESEDCLAFCDNATDDWPVEKAADYLLAQLEQLSAANPYKAVALIADGELSSEVTGDGIGGRNSAFVLACVKRIAGKGIAVLSAGTDGIDGNSPAAGAVADGATFGRAALSGLDPGDYFRRSDSFRFFRAVGDDLTIGPTGNNLRDLRLLIAQRRG